jgi:CRP-like cAMP-binding protein
MSILKPAKSWVCFDESNVCVIEAGIARKGHNEAMIIERASLFQGMSPQFLQSIGKCLAWHSGPAGTYLFRRGDPADHLYILGEGRVRLSYGEEGQIALVVTSPGDAFGWSCLIEREAYTASAECLVATTVARLQKQDLTRIFDQDSVSGLAFYRRLARLLAERLTDFYKYIPAAHGEKHAAPGF